MNKEELKALFVKYHEGTATEDERALLEAWYLQHNEVAQPHLSSAKIAAAKNAIYRRLPGNQGEFLRIGARMAAAAVIIGILITATFIYVVHNQPKNTVQLVHDLPPGKNKAILSLASGQQINLSDAANGQLLQQQGVQILKSKAGQIVFDYSGHSAVAAQNNISTPNGGQWQIRLPDGTQVWLNAATTLTFPNSFTGTADRVVTLKGEAYFEVAKDARHPFIVISGNQRIAVLGTHFNINSYPDEPDIKTTLVEGKVKVSLLGSKQTLILSPGEQSTVSPDGLQKERVDTDDALAWKNGYFQFDNEPINSIMRKLSRWYDIDVQYSGHFAGATLTGRVSRNNNISQVIQALEATKTVHIQMEGRRATVMR